LYFDSLISAVFSFKLVSIKFKSWISLSILAYNCFSLFKINSLSFLRVWHLPLTWTIFFFIRLTGSFGYLNWGTYSDYSSFMTVSVLVSVTSNLVDSSCVVRTIQSFCSSGEIRMGIAGSTPGPLLIMSSYLSLICSFLVSPLLLIWPLNTRV
jgi:hypothetical protein